MTALAFSPAVRRWGFWGLAALGLAALALWAFLPQALTVEVARVSTGRFEQVIEKDGQFRLKNRYVVTAPTAAELLRPTLKVGDTVRAGDVVARLMPLAPAMIDHRTLRVLQQRVGRDQAARQVAAAQLARLRTALAQADLEAQRAQQLAQEHFISASAKDQALLTQRSADQALQAGQAQLQAAEFSLAESQAALTQSEPTTLHTPQRGWSLRSPVNGQVIKLQLSSATTVSAGQALLEIGDTDAMEAVIDVLSSEARQVAVGARVQLNADMQASPLMGRVTLIEPLASTKVSALGIEEQRVNVIVAPDRDSDPAQRLGDGFRVDARIVVAAQDKALLLPSAALLRDGMGWRVMLMQNGRARAQRITLKDRNADMAWIASDAALRDGDLVVLYPGAIAEGQRVKVR
jgi:HlyD family secretion protein